MGPAGELPGAPFSPSLTPAHTNRGYGGLDAPRRGARVRGPALLSRPKNPGNGQEATTAQAAPVCDYHPLRCSLDRVLPGWILRMPMAARGGGGATHVIALVRGGRALGGRAALAGCLRRPSTLLKGEPRVV